MKHIFFKTRWLAYFLHEERRNKGIDKVAFLFPENQEICYNFMPVVMTSYAEGSIAYTRICTYDNKVMVEYYENGEDDVEVSFYIYDEDGMLRYDGKINSYY